MLWDYPEEFVMVLSVLSLNLVEYDSLTYFIFAYQNNQYFYQ